MKKALLFYIASTTAALAHAGHEAAVISGDAHWLMQADHLAVVVLGLVAAGLGLRSLIRRPARRKA